MTNANDLYAQMDEHRNAIKKALAVRRRLADRLDAIYDEPVEPEEPYRSAQKLQQAARRAEITEALRSADAQVQRTTNAAAAFARSVTAQATAATAVDLSSEEWSRAAATSSVLEAEMAGASFDDLADRLEGAALTGDRVEQYAAALVIDRLLAAATPRDEEERGRIRAARELVRDIRTSMRSAELNALATAAHELMGFAGRADGVVHAEQMERGESSFQPRQGDRMVKLSGDAWVGYGPADAAS